MPLISHVKLRDKFLLTIISVFVLVFLIFSFILIKFEEKQLIENTGAQAQILARALSLNFINCMQKASPGEEIKKVVSLLQADKNILNIVIRDNNDNTIFRSNTLGSSIADKTQIMQMQTILYPTFIQIAYPLIDSDQNIGTMFLDYSLDSVQAKLDYFRYFIIISAFLVLLIAILSSQKLAKMVTRQIDLMHQSLQKVNNGNYSHKVPVIANDELGDLAEAFNTLFINLKDSYKDAYIKTQKLTSKKNMLDAILSNLNEGVIVTDKLMQILEINSYAEETFDVFARLVIGQPIQEIAKNNEYIDQLKKFTKDTIQQAEFNLTMTGQKQTATYKVSLIRAINEFGEASGIISVFVDMTKEHQIDEMKTNLMQIVSHELKTPLVSIIGFIDMVLKQSKSYMHPEHYEFMEIAKTSAEQLKNLVNNILNLSKLKTKELELELSSFELNPFLEEIIFSFTPQLEQKNLKITTGLAIADLIIETDREKIRQVLINLIANAIKFTNEGLIAINTRLVENNSIVRIDIADTGIGISRKHLPEIFDRFKQLDISFTRNFEGAGLGLAIVKEIVTLLGGSIEVDSLLGKGSTFSILLPLDRKTNG